MKKRTKNNLGCSFFVIAIPLSLFLAVLLTVGLVFLVFRADYAQWQTKFEGSHLSEDFSKIVHGEPKSIDKKIDAFSKSIKKSDFIEISSSEFVQLLGNKVNENLPSSIKVTDGYIDASEGSWKMYYKAKYRNSFSVWVFFDLNKDETEGTDLYATDIKVGDLSIIDWGGGSIVSSINEGIRESMTLLTQKDFTGRVIRNIELDEEKMIIKGDK